MARTSTTYRNVRRAAVAELAPELRELLRREVVVGIPDTPRTPEAGQTSTPSNATIGYLMETGSPANNIPARPFLKPGMAAVRPAIAAHMREAALAALDGNVGAAEVEMAAAGQVGAESVRRKMSQGPFAPLKPATVKARRRRGRSGSKPLLDTRQLEGAVTSELRKR